MTYGEIYKEFCDKFPNADVKDYRPSDPMYIPQLSREIPNTEIIEKYDFIVGSTEIEKQLIEVLLEGADVVCTPYVENKNVVCLVKKFDITDELKEEQNYGITSFSAW